MRRSSEVAAVVLGGLVLFGPIIFSLGAPTHNLRDFALAPLALYWTVGTALLIGPLLALSTVPGDWFERWFRNTTSFVMAIPSRTFAIGLVVAVLLLTAGASW